MDEERFVLDFVKLLLIFILVLPFVGANSRSRFIKVKSRVPKIRVQIGKAFPEITVSGMDISRKLHLQDDFKRYDGRKSIYFNCRNLSSSKKKLRKPMLLASLNSPTGLLSLGENKYQGKIHILSSKNNSSCDVIHETHLESYIPPLLSKEMHGSWPVEALKAQAVAARTYALHKIRSKQVSKKLGHEAYYDLENSEKHQVSGSFFDSTKKTHIASKKTAGEILYTKDGKLTPIFFHADCGGKTLLPINVWGERVQGYKAVPCGYPGKRKWKSTVKMKEFKRFLTWISKKNHMKELREDVNEILRVMIAPDRFSNVRLRVYFGEKVFLFNKSLLRRYFGRKRFPSNHFVVTRVGSRFKIKGRGNGHGVGMSQVGAKRFAEMGWDYKKILSYYYPEHVIKKIY